MRPWLVAGAMLLALGLGGVVVWLGLTPHPSATNATIADDGTTSREALTVSRQILAELRQLRAAISAAQIPARQVATPSDISASDGDRLTATLERLVAALGERPASAANTPASTVSYAAHPDRLAATHQLGIEERARAHFFWTYARMLEQYGPPERMNASDGQLVWIYRDPSTQREMGFVFFEGFVIDAWG